MKTRRRIPIGIKILISFLTVIIVLLAAAGIYIKSKLDKINYSDGKVVHESIEPEEDVIDESIVAGLEEKEAIISEEPVKKSDNVLNILLLGTDERTGYFDDNARSDSMMLCSFNYDKKRISLVSLERGMGVPILEGVYEGQWDWLTHTYRYGGADLVMKEVQYCFKVEVNRFVRVNFVTFKQIINAVGGVDISLSAAEAEYVNQSMGTGAYSAGVNHLNGEAALSYARCRKIDSDWGRIQRQRNVIFAALGKLKSLSPAKLDEFLNQVLPLVQTNFSQGEIIELMSKAPSIVNFSFQQMTIPKAGTYGIMYGMGNRDLFAVDFETNAEILKSFLYEGE